MACSRQEAPDAGELASQAEPPQAASAETFQAHSAAAPMARRAKAADVAAGAAANAQAPAQRYLAVRHQLQIEAPAGQVAAVWAAVREACGQLDCDLLSAQLQRETAQAPVSASLTLRVAPQHHADLLGTLGGTAQVVNDSTSSEDVTAQVIDVEAHIKNRSDYRDSLRELLADTRVKRTLSELFEIRDTLAQVQAEIDSALTQRKLLEQQTAKVWVQMQFRAERGLSTSQYSPWRELAREAVQLGAESARTLVRVAAVALPWLLLLALLAGVLRGWWRRRRAA